MVYEQGQENPHIRTHTRSLPLSHRLATNLTHQLSALLLLPDMRENDLHSQVLIHTGPDRVEAEEGADRPFHRFRMITIRLVLGLYLPFSGVLIHRRQRQ